MKELYKIADYLNHSMGLNFVDKGSASTLARALPLYLKQGVSFRKFGLENIDGLMIYPKEKENLQYASLCNNARQIREKSNINTILVLSNIDSLDRKLLIRMKQDFIVPDKQAYLPSWMMSFNERGMQRKGTIHKSLTPSAQLLLFYHFEKEPVDGLKLADIAKKLSYSQKTITKAVQELEAKGFCSTSRTASGKNISFVSLDKIWNDYSNLLISPIDDVLYIDDDSLIPTEERITSYDTALAKHTFIADSDIKAYAIDKNSETSKVIIQQGLRYGAVRVELWKYNPAILAKDNYIDPLSLCLIYRDSDDERVQSEINKLINRILCEE